MNVEQLQYDLKRDAASIGLHDAPGGTFVNVQFPLKTDGALSEGDLEQKMKERAKEILQAAIAAL